MITKILSFIKKNRQLILVKKFYAIKIVFFIFSLFFLPISNALNDSDLQNIEDILESKFTLIENIPLLRRLEKEQYREAIATVKRNYNNEINAINTVEVNLRLNSALATLIYIFALSYILYPNTNNLTTTISIIASVFIDILLSTQVCFNHILLKYPAILTNLIEKYNIHGRFILDHLQANNILYILSAIGIDCLATLILALKCILNSSVSSGSIMFAVVLCGIAALYRLSNRTLPSKFKAQQQETIFENLLLSRQPTFRYTGNLAIATDDLFIERFYKWMSWSNKNNKFLDYLISSNYTLYQQQNSLLYNKEFNLSFKLIEKQQFFPVSLVSSIYKENGAFFIEINNDLFAQNKHKNLAIISTDNLIYIMTAVTPKVTEVLNKISIERENRDTNIISQDNESDSNIIITKIPKNKDKTGLKYLEGILLKVLGYLCYSCEDISLYKLQ